MSKEKKSALGRVLSSMCSSREEELTPDEVQTQDGIDQLPDDVVILFGTPRPFVLIAQLEASRERQEQAAEAARKAREQELRSVVREEVERALADARNRALGELRQIVEMEHAVWADDGRSTNPPARRPWHLRLFYWLSNL